MVLYGWTLSLRVRGMSCIAKVQSTAQSGDLRAQGAPRLGTAPASCSSGSRSLSLAIALPASGDLSRLIF